MSRDEVYQLRLTKAEKDEMGRRSREQGISIAKWLRQRMNLDASGAQPVAHDHIAAGLAAVKVDERTATEVYDRLEAAGVQLPERSEFQLRVAKHKNFMSTRKAEAKARKELGL